MRSLSPCTISLLQIVFLISSAIVFSVSINVEAGTTTKGRPFNNSISAILVFGDSTVDSGNNNYINTLAKCNFPPYGVDFPNYSPKGRFTNGRLTTDFIASYMGIKENVPPYLDPALTVEELMTGVSFASAASGFDATTAQISRVIPIQKQLNYFTEYKKRLEKAIGKQETKNLINKAVFILSAGTNDFIIHYFRLQLPRHKYNNVLNYQEFLFQIIQQFTQRLIEEGARLIAVVGVPPIGCLPAVITLNASSNRQCNEDLSYIGRDYNQKLQKKLKAMQINSNAKFFYADIYTPLDDMIQKPSEFGFSHVNVGCCGTGFVEGSYLCNHRSPICVDRSKYIFWDSIHPSETTYNLLFKSLQPIIDDVMKAGLQNFILEN